MDWQTTIQNWGGLLVDRWSQAEYVQPYEVQKLQLQALGQTGYYAEGQPGTQPAPGGGFNITPGMVLLLGGAVLAVMMLRD